MDIFFKNIRQATSFIIIFLGFLFFSSQVSLVMADTVTSLPVSIWGTTIYSLPFSACPGGTGGTVYTIPWTGNCCSTANTTGTPCGTIYNYAYAGTTPVWSTLNDGDPDNNNGECSARNSACGFGTWSVYAPATIGCGQAGYVGCASTSTGTTGCCIDCGCAYPSISTVCTSPGAYGIQACQ